MVEKTEWEIVDAEETRHVESRDPLSMLMQSLLGPWWRWKAGAVAALAVVTLVFFATLIGAVILVGAGIAFIGIAASKIKQRWLGHGRGISVRDGGI